MYLGLVLLLGALVRLWPSSLPYLELDSAIYARTSAELRQAWETGALWHLPFVGAHYSSVDYWPPLFPILGAIFSPGAVAAWAGWLAIIPVFWLTLQLFSQSEAELSLPASASASECQPSRALWGALTAAGIMALHPYLVWYSRVARTESLYILFFALAACMLWPRLRRVSEDAGGESGYNYDLPLWGRWLRSAPWRYGAGGLFLAAAYATRYDALFLIPCVWLTATCLRLSPGGFKEQNWRLWWRETRSMWCWSFLGLLLGAAPYLIYLAWLNGGAPALMAPHKVLYDALEGAWTRAYGRPMFEFTCAYGLPGIFSLPADSAQVHQLLEAQVPGLLRSGLIRLPQVLASVSCNWWALALPALLALKRWRCRAVQAMFLACLPALGMAIFMSWDPNPRYYAFTLIPGAILAAIGLDALLGEPSGRRGRYLWLSVAVPLWLGASWIVPKSVHFDQRGPADPLFYQMLPGAEQWALILWLAGMGLAAAASWKLPGLWAGLLGTLQALGLGWGAIEPALSGAQGAFRAALPLSLLGLTCLPLLIYATRPQRGGLRQWQWIALCWLVISLGDIATLEMWGVAHGRLVYSPQVGQQLSQAARERTWDCPAGAQAGFGNGGPRVLSLQQVDAVRSGARWVPWPTQEPVDQVLRRERPDYVVAVMPDPWRSDNRTVVMVPELEASGLVERVGSYASPGYGGVERYWRLYKLKLEN